MHFSVLMAVYNREIPEYLDNAIASVVKQTLAPSEIVVVKDGPLTDELEFVLAGYLNTYPKLFKIIPIDKNVGLGMALNIGLTQCSNEIVARMDSDDISKPWRFDRQVRFLIENDDLSVVGCTVEEFNISPGDLNRFRRLPTTSAEILRFAQFRNPLNHPTVVFRKNHIKDVGSYLDMPLFEDYYLWIRLLKTDHRLLNLDEALLYFRVGNDMIGRRHGFRYLIKEMKFIFAGHRLKFFTRRSVMLSFFFKIPMRLIPKVLLSHLYKRFLR